MERYQLSLNAIGLPNRGGLFRMSSPYAKVKVVSGPHQGVELGRTEAIPRHLSPDWCKIFFLEFSPNDVTNLEITVWDEVKGKKDVKIGGAMFEATTVFRQPGRTASEQIGNKSTSKDYSVAHVKWNIVYRSETVYNHLNPLWKEVDMGLEELCYGKLDWPLKIQVLDHNSNGKHKVIGEYETTVEALQTHISVKGNADRGQAIQLGQEDKNKTYGLLCVLKATNYYKIGFYVLRQTENDQSQHTFVMNRRKPVVTGNKRRQSFHPWTTAWVAQLVRAWV
eukprot:scaffold7679_cov134-Cylindrotheca_fusiformis.AAC.1